MSPAWPGGRLRPCEGQGASSTDHLEMTSGPMAEQSVRRVMLISRCDVRERQTRPISAALALAAACRLLGSCQGKTEPKRRRRWVKTSAYDHGWGCDRTCLNARFCADARSRNQTGSVPVSVGRVGDSYDAVRAEAFVSPFKAEVICRRGPWRSCGTGPEFATQELRDWSNSRHLLDPTANNPPVQALARLHAQSEELAMVA